MVTSPAPGLARDVDGTAGTMFAALYGELVLHPEHDPELDAYALFHQRSLAMGWLDDRSAGGTGRRAPGLWAMNDAGWDHPLAAPGAGLVAWFQVEVSALAADRPLPVQPFLRCAVDVASLVGRLDLSAVQVLLPGQSVDPSARPSYAPVPSLRTAPWFTGGAAHAMPVEVQVSGTGNAAAASRLAHGMGQLDQSVFVPETEPVADLGRVIPPPFDDGFRGGPATFGVVLHGRLASWSGDAVGWLGETVTDLLARGGVRSPLLLTVARQQTEM